MKRPADLVASAWKRFRRFASFRRGSGVDSTAIIDRVMPQDDRAAERTIPILPVIDERLSQNALNGFRYEDMPPDQEAYRLGMKAIDEMAQARFQAAISSLSPFTARSSF